LAGKLEISPAEVASFEFLPDWIAIMSAWLTRPKT
jgi:hypothetical protein